MADAVWPVGGHTADALHSGAVWLRHRFTLGSWVVLVGVVVGVLAAVSCLCSSLQALDRQGRPAKKDGEKTPPPISFDRH